MRRLAAEGWLEYESGFGARLVGKGHVEAERLSRRICLLGCLLEGSLGLDPETAHADAEALAEATSPSLEQALAEYLGEAPAEGEVLSGR